jgi:hypothetical protein
VGLCAICQQQAGLGIAVHRGCAAIGSAASRPSAPRQPDVPADPVAVGTWIGAGVASLPVTVIVAFMVSLATSDDTATRHAVNVPGIWALALFVSAGILIVGAGLGAAMGGAVGGTVSAVRSVFAGPGKR